MGGTASSERDERSCGSFAIFSEESLAGAGERPERAQHCHEVGSPALSFVSCEDEPDNPDPKECYQVDRNDDAWQLATQVAQAARAELPPGVGDWITASDGYRLLVATEQNKALAIKKLHDAASWRQQTLEPWIASSSEREMRVIALGQHKRPLCYHCAAHQRWGDVLPAHWATSWDEGLSLAAQCGPQEEPYLQMDILIDCHGFQPLLNLSISPYIKLVPSIDSYFAERIHRFFLVDFPLAARFLWMAAQPLLPPKTKEKIVFISRRDVGAVEAMLDQLSVDSEMRAMLDELFRMNGVATPSTGREQSHTLTSEFFRRQLAKLRTKHRPDSPL